jgi:hypothetical protein
MYSVPLTALKSSSRRGVIPPAKIDRCEHFRERRVQVQLLGFTAMIPAGKMTGVELWSIIGKAAVLVTVLTGIFKLIHWWRSPRGKLVAGVMPQLFKLPPTVEQEVESFAMKAKQAEEEFFEEYPGNPEGHDQLHARAEAIAWRIRRAIPNSLSFETRLIAGCWFARVDNKGKKKCSEVSLHLPHSILAHVQRDSDLSAQVATVRAVVDIGELRPKAYCYVVAWTNTRVDNSDLRDVQLTHEAGVGKVHGSWQTNRIGFMCGKFLDRAFLIPVVLIPLAILVLWASLLSLIQDAAKRTPKTAQPTPTPPASVTPGMRR